LFGYGMIAVIVFAHVTALIFSNNSGFIKRELLHITTFTCVVIHSLHPK